MRAPSAFSDSGLSREVIVIAALTAFGGMLRLWSLGRLGLVHFDEGIYAMAGLWVFSPKGLGGLDPTVIAYAPPGFPFLVGIAYSLLGASDVSAILVSILLGTLTIPAVGWLARRTFGRGAGAAAAAFAALSGPHIAFSRMALTDASFVLFWILAIGMGQRFLERPGSSRAVMLGVAVGVAQLFKYNGWIAAAVVPLGSTLWMLLSPRDRTPKSQAAIWGWGLLAAATAAIIYWPWFRFVEWHGGYAALIAHHRSYMSGISSWLTHGIALADQDEALSGGVVWLVLGGLVAAIGMLAVTDGIVEGSRTPARFLLRLVGFPALCAFPHSNWFGALFWLSVLIPHSSPFVTKANHFLVVAWALLAVMTPFYHPYARLLLPLGALSWVLMGGAFLTVQKVLDRLTEKGHRTVAGLPKPWAVFAGIGLLIPLLALLLGEDFSEESRFSQLLAPSDSLRRGCRTIAGDLPRDLRALRLYARPPVTFYLSGTVPLSPRPGLDRLFESGDASTWVLLDSAMVRQEGGIRGRLSAMDDRWELVREVPTTMNLPTLLDIDPTAAVRGTPDVLAPLLLFRPKHPGDR